MSASPVYISPEQLCIGLYVQLELSWWEHDFAFSNFKIKDEAQIRALRALNLERLRYDPARSDCAPLEPADSPGEAAVEAPPVDPQHQARQERAQKLRHLRSRLAEVDRRFSEASQRIKTLNQTLRSRPEDAVQQAGAIVSEMVETLLGAPGVVLHGITGKAAEDSYFHALNVTVLALLLGRQLGLDSEACHSLGLGALLHDIGKLEVPSKVLLKPEPLTRPEQQLLQMHTDFGLRMGQKLMLDDEVLRIIHEHHEHCDGSGYPRGLREAGIGRLSRLVAITNHFDGLCNPLDPRQALSPHEALVQMFKQQREQFDEVALKAFVRVMGIYPPGSLVQLEDERYALVLGMNPTQALRPTLILYDASVAKHEALIVDLAEDSDLAIARSLRPSQLPLEVLEYLSPRRNLSYHIEPNHARG
ncbi:HD-GYP domain-containing protein [Ectopseudomonas khazarica]|uniref:HD-GYP domain-containing protein n=1 Tax=Ectopseudomonas khazarica TaxID=2502979 RepID=UPI00106E644C|nr:HD domain-containing phosphohydrolase [Pseudomonas khazarica]